MGQTKHTADVPNLDEQQKKSPILPGFLHFTTNSAAPANPLQIQMAHGCVENVLRVEIRAIKITGLAYPLGGALPDIVAIRITAGGSNELKHKEYTNVTTVPDDAMFIEILGAATYINFGTPLLLYQSKDAFTLNNITSKVMDINGNPLNYTDLYMWIFIETLNYQ